MANGITYVKYRAKDVGINFCFIPRQALFAIQRSACYKQLILHNIVNMLYDSYLRKRRK